VAAPAIDATESASPEGEGQGDQSQVLVAVVGFVVTDLKHDLYVELLEMLMPVIEPPSDDVDEEELEPLDTWSGSEGGEGFADEEDEEEHDDQHGDAFHVVL
jgi:hypothetical protein